MKINHIYMRGSKKNFMGEGSDGWVFLVRGGGVRGLFLGILLREFKKFEFSGGVGSGKPPDPPFRSAYAVKILLPVLSEVQINFYKRKYM